jgi:hypothetical protein
VLAAQGVSREVNCVLLALGAVMSSKHADDDAFGNFDALSTQSFTLAGDAIVPYECADHEVLVALGDELASFTAVSLLLLEHFLEVALLLGFCRCQHSLLLGRLLGGFGGILFGKELLEFFIGSCGWFLRLEDRLGETGCGCDEWTAHFLFLDD